MSSYNETNDTGSGKAGKSMCYAFQRGECPYGDNCKFNHDPEFAGKKKQDEQPTSKSSSKSNDDSDSYVLSSGGQCKVVPATIAVCKWGKNCKLKRCRYRHDVDAGVDGDSPVPTANRNNSRDGSKTGEGGIQAATTDTITTTTTTVPSSKKPKVVLGICKWGKNCKLKRCRFKHEDNSEDSSVPSSQPLSFGKEKAPYCVEAGKSTSASTTNLPQNTTSSTPTTKNDEQQQRKTKSKKKTDKLVHKAIGKALKKAPKKKLRVKELRKMVKKKIGSLEKDEIKVAIRKAIAKNKGSMALLKDGKVVQLIAN